MAGGPVAATNYKSTTGEATYVSISPTGNSVLLPGVVGSFAAACKWYFRAELPQTLPSGTCTVRLRWYANATTGNTQYILSVADVAVGDDTGESKNAQGTTRTVTWSTGNDYQQLEETYTLNAVTITAGNTLEFEMAFDTASTLAADCGFEFSIIWV